MREEVLLLHVVGENRQPCCLAISPEILGGSKLSNVDIEEPRLFVAHHEIYQFSRLPGNSTGISGSNILSELKVISEPSK